MKTLLLAASAIMAVGISTGAHALSYTQVGTVATQKTDFTTPFSVTTGGTSNVPSTAFSGFFAAGATLNDVVVTFTANGTESGTLSNTSASSQTFSFGTSSAISLASGTNTPAALLALSGLTLTGAVTQYTLAAGGSTSILPTPNAFVPSTTTSTTTLTGAAASQFIGTNFVVDLSTSTGQSFAGGGGNITTSQTTTAGGTLTITYDYTPAVTAVPEPSTLAILGVGLVGLGFIRRRKSV